MSEIIICPDCGSDLVAIKNRWDRKVWHCPACGYTDESETIREMRLWQAAYERGYQR